MNHTSHFNILNLGNINNTPIIFIHGIGGSSSIWFFYYMIYLSKNYYLYAYDLRGHGRSFYPKKGYRLQDHSEDLNALVKQFENRKNKYFVSYSYGGNINLKWAINYAKKGDTIFLLDTPDVPKDKALVDQLLDDVRETLDGDFTKTSPFALMLRETVGKEIMRKSRRIKSYKDRLQLLYNTTFREEIMMDDSFTDSELNKIPCKIILIYATKGGSLDYANRLLKNIPNCELHILEGNHEIITQNHKEILKIIQR